jgi:hypothetical protein
MSDAAAFLAVLVGGVIGAWIITAATIRATDRREARADMEADDRAYWLSLRNDWRDDPPAGQVRAVIWEDLMRAELLRQAADRRRWL